MSLIEGQDQTRVIILTTNDGPKCYIPMTFWFQEKYNFECSSPYNMGIICVQDTPYSIFLPDQCSTSYSTLIGQAVLKKKMFKNNGYNNT